MGEHKRIVSPELRKKKREKYDNEKEERRAIDLHLGGRWLKRKDGTIMKMGFGRKARLKYAAEWARDAARAAFAAGQVNQAEA